MRFSPKKEKYVRWIKTIFFLITMLISLPPILLVIADALLPWALLPASHLNKYDFRSSLIDIPLVSIVRSFIILCVYSFCDLSRGRGPYLGIATICSVLSLAFVSLKAAYVFRGGGGYSGLALFVCSFGLAIGHVVVAYRTSTCTERRKLLVYRIDIEAVSACKNGFPRHNKLLQGGGVIMKPRQKQISIPHFSLNQIQFSQSQASDLSKGDVQPDEETQKL